MSKRQIILGLIFTIMLTLGASTASAITRSITIRVKGMTCGGCATTVEKALKATDGVVDARVSYERGEARIKYDDQKLSAVKLREVINSTGYEVVGSTKAASKRGKWYRPAKSKSTSCGGELCCIVQ